MELKGVDITAKKHPWQTDIQYKDPIHLINSYLTNGKNHRTIKYSWSSTIGEWLAGYRRNRKEGDIFQILHWPYLLIPPKKRRHPNMLNVQCTHHRQIHSLKLWQFETSLFKILSDKQPREPFQKHQTRGHLEFF